MENRRHDSVIGGRRYSDSTILVCDRNDGLGPDSVTKLLFLVLGNSGYAGGDQKDAELYGAVTVYHDYFLLAGFSQPTLILWS